ncbi:MAG TPA: DUF3750 domain-containing protein [Candidatus Paceibacterota bacterium]|nr:DUF3750 domain-containing protein [Candidatus Paceibacterota bacterium]
MPEVDKTKVQVFFMSSPCPFPNWLARHPFMTINEYGNLTRFEVLHRRNKNDTYIHIDEYEAFKGLPYVLPFRRFSWKAQVLGVVEGEEAIQIAKFIKASKGNYPFKDEYQFLGHNSNTYVGWVLKHFPKLNIKLPPRSFGKQI